MVTLRGDNLPEIRTRQYEKPKRSDDRCHLE
jgi:hypothetical protein